MNDEKMIDLNGRSASDLVQTMSVDNWSDLPTTKEMRSGYVCPQLRNPTDDRIKAVATQISRPMWITRGIESYRKTLESDTAPEEVKKGRLKAIAQHHAGPVIKDMEKALEQANDDVAELEGRVTEAFAPVNADAQIRLNQIRDELAKLERPQAIKAVHSAIANQDMEKLKAVATLPHSEALCPAASYNLAKEAYKRAVLGDDAAILPELKELRSQLAFALEAFRMDLGTYNAFSADYGRQEFQDTLSANFEKAGE